MKSSYVRVPLMGDTLSTKSVPAKVIHSPRWYGRVPASVCLDVQLSSEAVRIYSVISLSVYKERIACVGMRHLAKLTGFSAMTVKRRIDELVKAGHVEAKEAKRGQRASYTLTSPVFGQKQVVQNLDPLSPAKEGAKFAACRTCGGLTAKLSLDALCRSCVKAAEEIRLVNDALAVLGHDATEEQVTKHLQLAKVTRSVRRALRAIREAA